MKSRAVTNPTGTAAARTARALLRNKATPFCGPGQPYDRPDRHAGAGRHGRDDPLSGRERRVYPNDRAGVDRFLDRSRDDVATADPLRGTDRDRLRAHGEPSLAAGFQHAIALAPEHVRSDPQRRLPIPALHHGAAEQVGLSDEIGDVAGRRPIVEVPWR